MVTGTVSIVASSSEAMDVFGDTVAMLNSIFLKSYYRMLRGQIGVHLPPQHPMIYVAI